MSQLKISIYLIFVVKFPLGGTFSISFFLGGEGGNEGDVTDVTHVKFNISWFRLPCWKPQPPEVCQLHYSCFCVMVY